MQTVGELLRSEREKKGLSIKDVEAATSIRALYINAIEESDYKIVPGEVYLKGFIRNYANFLGLSGPNMVDLYRQQQQTTASATPLPDAAASATTTSPAPSLDDKTSQSGGTVKWILGGIVIISIAGAIWWVNAQQPSAPAPAPQQLTQVQPPAPPSSPTPTPAPASNLQTKPIQIITKYNDECWTQVIADGKEIYEGIPHKGDSLSWDATNNLTVKFGNAGSVDATYNGKPLGKLGDKGEVVVKTFTANQQKQ
ncbi:XRE family transcriptional regulator [Sporomusaceae bacterium FL31]|nr:XRE family transcriptional regulator [Sporomusaceae bacterium FL31]GCE33519.1 XRE family transcriptional regulator [Sporomusaceae bacterium]